MLHPSVLITKQTSFFKLSQNALKFKAILPEIFSYGSAGNQEY